MLLTYFFSTTSTTTTTVPPRWILEPTDKAFAQGSDAKVECKADGFPKPQVTWKKAVGKLRHREQCEEHHLYLIPSFL